MTQKSIYTTIAMAAMLAAGSAQAQEVVRLGNLKFAHYGAVSYIKEIAPKCGIKVEEKIFAKGLDAMQAVIAGELDVATTASEAAISGRASGAPIYRRGRLRQGRRAPGGPSRPGHQDGQGPEGQESRRHPRRHPGSAADGRAAKARPDRRQRARQGRAADLPVAIPT